GPSPRSSCRPSSFPRDTGGAPGRRMALVAPGLKLHQGRAGCHFGGGRHVGFHDLLDAAGSAGLDLASLFFRVVTGTYERAGLDMSEAELLLAHALPLRELGRGDPPGDRDVLRRGPQVL